MLSCVCVCSIGSIINHRGGSSGLDDKREWVSIHLLLLYIYMYVCMYVCMYATGSVVGFGIYRLLTDF